MARTMAISGASILAAARSSSCLIVAVVIVGDLRGGRRRLVDAPPEQVEIEDLARARRRGARAEPRVLDEDRERDRRLFDRRERDEQRMIAVALVDRRLGVLLVLLERDHLRGAGLAGAHVGGAREGARARALLVDADHGALDELE